MEKNKNTILVIDDDEGIADAFQVLLDTVGYKVIVSLNADIIQTLTRSNLPDLILLDVLLSGADGRDVCKKLKKDKLTKEIPIIMISAHPSAGRSIKAAGADDFIPKPFEMNDLLTKVAFHIKQ